MKSNRIASIIIESNRIVRSVNRSGPSLNPPEFWMGGLNTCQTPLILRKKFLGGGLAPLKLI